MSGRARSGFALALLVAAAFAALHARARADSQAPPATVFKPGPNAELAQRHCVACHSADYVYMQPPLSRAQWTAEVTKMQKAFAAPIPDADVTPLVDYLMTQNGKS